MIEIIGFVLLCFGIEDELNPEAFSHLVISHLVFRLISHKSLGG